MKIINTISIETPRLILRPFTIHDLNSLHDLFKNPDVVYFTPHHPSQNVENTKSYLYTSILPVYEENKEYYYALERKSDAEVLGYVTLKNLGDANDLGYAIKKEFWHQGYVYEAGKYFIIHLANTSIPFITATHDVLNPNSGRVMQKLGMQYQYTYKEVVQPKNYLVTFRLYQYNFDPTALEYRGYADKYNAFIEKVL